MDVPDLRVRFAAAQDGTDAVCVLFVFKNNDFSREALDFDEATGKALTAALADSTFDGTAGQTRELSAHDGVRYRRALMVGLGERPGLTDLVVENAAAHAYDAVRLSGARGLLLRLDQFDARLAAHAAFAVLMASYRFDTYLTQQGSARMPSLNEVMVVTADPAAAELAFSPLAALCAGVKSTRDLVSEPPNVLHPEEFARRAQALTCLGLHVEVLDEGDMATLRMGALLGVGQGSHRASRLVVLKWNGAADPAAAPIVFVGKGVTFDTGGISLKSNADMQHMKADMAGAAVVVGLMQVLASRDAKVNAVGVVGLVENMPGGNAQRPGDVVTSMSGQTIEIVNTDAEGRLVLADALWYAQTRFEPKAMVDLATLTGAVTITLGDMVAGVLSNDDTLASELVDAGRAEGEMLWQLPLVREYDALHDTPVADMKNVGGGSEAGAITAALFLQRFVGATRWAHLDIEGVAWRTKPSSRAKEGATGYGVRLLDRWVREHHEGRDRSAGEQGSFATGSDDGNEQRRDR